ncbi:AAA family ATPase [Coleofasciculus sp.]|uniref:AAA family ATPase n=1 Tax=Coleofasciculus sp. TaxID=3100458 RepID=UPI003A1FB829
MLRDLTIQNYRCFKNFHIDGLARVNLLVGMNNCGKTTLLEAVYLFVKQGNPQCLGYLLHNRGELVERSSFSFPGESPHPQFYYQISHLFYGHAPSLNSTIPLSSMGEGMRRILNLAMAAVTVENGFLLIDEIETGLYYEAQTEMWRFILEVAKEFNIQVFATTHSWDCICAFQEALDDLDDSSVGKLFRLSRKGEDIHPVEYPADELSVAVRQSIEVR